MEYEHDMTRFVEKSIWPIAYDIYKWEYITSLKCLLPTYHPGLHISHSIALIIRRQHSQHILYLGVRTSKTQFFFKKMSCPTQTWKLCFVRKSWHFGHKDQVSIIKPMMCCISFSGSWWLTVTLSWLTGTNKAFVSGFSSNITLFQPSCQNEMLAVNVSANHKCILVCGCTTLTSLQNMSHRVHIAMFMTSLRYQAVELQTRRLPSKWPQSRTAFQHLQVWNHWIFLTRHQDNFQLCLWRPNQIFKAQSMIFFNPDQVGFAPKSNQGIKHRLGTIKIGN